MFDKNQSDNFIPNSKTQMYIQYIILNIFYPLAFCSININIFYPMVFAALILISFTLWFSPALILIALVYYKEA